MKSIVAMVPAALSDEPDASNGSYGMGQSLVTHGALSNEVDRGHGARGLFPTSPIGRMGPMEWVAWGQS
jgi:hypothetical protein